ncbi:MAG: hypothetical protein AAF541_17365 [Pseudomonadota bacterium]
MNIVLATCREWPEPASDLPLREALRARGHTVASMPWNEDQNIFYSADLIILRACWDYYQNPERFSEWIESLAVRSAVVANPLNVVSWNFDKRYLLELQALGLNVVPTWIRDARDELSIRSFMSAEGFSSVVRKPLFGQSGHYIDHLSASTARWPVAPFSGPALLQPFQEHINEVGETLMVFFAGEYSHTIKRTLADGEWRSNSQFGSKRSSIKPSDQVIQQGQDILRTVTQAKDWRIPPLYARIDGLVSDDVFTLMELELIEPALGFDLVPEAARRFAAVIEKFA